MNESLLRSQIEPLQAKRERGQVIGVYSQSRWEGGETLNVGSEAWRVAQCDSVLEVRQRLSEEADAPLVLVTSLASTDVGDDVRARLFKQRLLPVDPWTLLAGRFKARQVDPVLRQWPEVADAAIEALGASEPMPATSGVLTADAVWQIVLQNRLGLSQARPDLQDLLEWMVTDGAAKKWKGLGVALRERLSAWLALSLGELGPVLIRSLESDHGEDAVAIGLVLGVLGERPSDSKAKAAAIRLEPFTGALELPSASARQWNEAAERWLARHCGAGDATLARQHLTRADQILESVRASDLASFSRWSPLGFQHRLAAFAEALAGEDSNRRASAFAYVIDHEGARYLEEMLGRRERAEMAMRLSRWLNGPVVVPTSLDHAVSLYENEGSWVDWARHYLLTGDEPEGVSRSYRRLFDQVTARREEENRGFAELLATDTLANRTPLQLLLMEDVLSKVAAPLAKSSAGGVLFIVMDGMSLAVWREMAVDLHRHGWMEWVPEQNQPTRSVLTVLPSATTYSRATLLCGALSCGAQSIEKRGFEDHADLRAAGKAILFHKDQIGASGSDLNETVRLEIRSGSRKIVGVIVNVVDDSLEGPEQLSIHWSLRSVSILQALLSEARDAGRIVVLASDHGHVLDHGSKLIRRADAADRWRTAGTDDAVGRDEILLRGTRVIAEGGSIICPTSETVRYTPNRRQGYHGGVTPQECLAPIAVLAPALMAIDGWVPQPSDPPDWWFEGGAPKSAPVQRPRKVSAKRKESETAALPLFQEPTDSTDWIMLLMKSEVFSDQMSTFGGRLKKDQVEQSLRVLADRNMVMLKGAFAQRIGRSLISVDGLIASLQRILNVEGYPVLSVDSSQTIRINLTLLREQFALGDGHER